MNKQSLLLIFSIVSLAFSAYAQKASDYFPSGPGFKWFYKTTPLDSLNNSIDSLSFVSIDSFALNQNYQGKYAALILQKNGTKESVLYQDYIDSNFVSVDSTIIWNYTTFLPGLDHFGIGFPNSAKGWHSVYRIFNPVNLVYPLFSMDTSITYQGTNIKLGFAVTGKRIADQNITTAIGTFLCKTFVFSVAITAKLSIFTIPVATIIDTTFLAPGNYILRDYRSSANADLAKYGLPSFYVPGSKMDIIAPPPVLEVEPIAIFINSSSGDSLCTIFNSGSDTLSWSAKVIAGTSWLHLLDTMGIGDGTIRFSYSQNTDSVLRVRLIYVSDTNSWGRPQTITVHQEHNITSISGTNGILNQFTLTQNYPNPFNPSTIIKYTVPRRSFVTFKIFNTLGQQVALLINGIVNPGTYEVRFNALGLSSGVYYYFFNADDNFIQSKKMIFLK